MVGVRDKPSVSFLIRLTANVSHEPLSHCILAFIEKDNKMIEPIMKRLLELWPVTGSEKEVRLPLTARRIIAVKLFA